MILIRCYYLVSLFLLQQEIHSTKYFAFLFPLIYVWIFPCLWLRMRHNFSSWFQLIHIFTLKFWFKIFFHKILGLKWTAFQPLKGLQENTPFFFHPFCEASREVANLTERKNLHTPAYGVKEFVCLSVCLWQALTPITSGLAEQNGLKLAQPCYVALDQALIWDFYF